MPSEIPKDDYLLSPSLSPNAEEVPETGHFGATIECGTEMTMPIELPRADYIYPQISAKKHRQVPIKFNLNFKVFLKKLKK